MNNTNNAGIRNPRAGAKAVTWDWEFLSTYYDDETKCYRLTERQVAFLSVCLHVAAWATRWFNPPTDFNDVLRFVNDTSLALMTPETCFDATAINDENECSENGTECEDDMSCKLPIVWFNGAPFPQTFPHRCALFVPSIRHKTVQSCDNPACFYPLTVLARYCNTVVNGMPYQY